ncbi:MAG: sigma-70 family RNA polymerase sigma factor [Planctomycetes bacterium]|nr:sigma-70 family RNA polymerase sigma factor [Planctomycetota bacterium]
MEPSPTCPSAKARVGDPLHAEMLALRAGRSESLRAIYDAASPRVHGLALRITGDARLAEEATVETFVRAWRRAATYDPARGDALAWLLALARSAALDGLRAARRSAATAPEPPFALEALPADAGTAASAGAELAERRERVRAATRSLPPEQAAVLALSFWEGLPHTAIAERLGIPLGTVKTRIRLALTRLAQVLRSVEPA